MSNSNEKRIKTKPVESETINTLAHSSHRNQDIPLRTHTVAIKNAQLESRLQHTNVQVLTEAPADETVHIESADSQNVKIGLEDIFPIDPEVVHRAELNLAAEKHDAHHENLSFPNFSDYPFLFNAASYYTFWGFFWRDFSLMISK